MYQPVRWTRAFGMLTLGVALLAAACEAPTSPAAAPPDESGGLVLSQARKTSVTPSLTPLCPEPWDADRVLCRVDVNVKHGNDSGLPVNLKGVKNGKQGKGKGDGPELPVSALGTTQFDLSAVYLNTLRIGDAEKGAPPATPLNVIGNGKYQASIVDLNGDGILDLMLHFSLAEMVANGDISETTTELCLWGEGPGYVLNGCGMEPPLPPPPPPPYASLPDCSFAYEAQPGYRCAVIQPYGRDGDVTATLLMVKYWLVDADDPTYGYPNWVNIPAAELLGQASGEGRVWTSEKLPYGTDNTTTPPDPANTGTYLTVTCGLTPSAFIWAEYEQLLVRTDLDVPPEARNVSVELLVDDGMQVFYNGTTLTDGATTIAPGECASYASTLVLPVPDDARSLDALDKLAVRAADLGGWVNYLDFRVFAEVPIY